VRAIGPDPEALARIGVFVELHVEQGKQLAHTPATVGVASSIWPHGRWHFCFSGEANHAGSTLLNDRHDPVLPFAEVVVEARRIAATHSSVSTFGRVKIDPNGTNAIASRVDAWLDARGPDDASVEHIVEELTAYAGGVAEPHGVGVTVERESWTSIVEFDVTLSDRIVSTLTAGGRDAPVLHTAAGHDSGILASKVPTAMLFVRNPTGISHSPEEFAEESDCIDGVVALTDVLRDLLTGPLTVVS
jgi:N-carbamoyl-L-amino-acid hydrolase